ncbi:MAG: hypothetical protein COV08_01105, partial [Candidatus Vogelbacteria bacterium CG10_big_fil_rev_8_21_14_0_10_49_38]
TLVTTDSDGYKGLSLIGLIPAIVGAIQEQQAKIQALVLSSGQSLAGQLVAQIQAVAGVFERLKAGWLEVEEGITIKDRATGAYYCLYVENGIQKSLSGRCDEVLLATPPTIEPTVIVPEETEPEPEPEPESSSEAVAVPVTAETVEPLDESIVAVPESAPESSTEIAPETTEIEPVLIPSEPAVAPPVPPEPGPVVTPAEES